MNYINKIKGELKFINEKKRNKLLSKNKNNVNKQDGGSIYASNLNFLIVFSYKFVQIKISRNIFFCENYSQKHNLKYVISFNFIRYFAPKQFLSNSLYSEFQNKSSKGLMCASGSKGKWILDCDVSVPVTRFMIIGIF